MPIGASDQKVAYDSPAAPSLSRDDLFRQVSCIEQHPLLRAATILPAYNRLHWQHSAPSNTTKENQDEDIANHGCTLAHPRYWRVQHQFSPFAAGGRTSRAGRTNRTDRRIRSTG